MQYTIVRTAGSPGWSTVPSLSLGNILWEPDCGIRAGGQLCHDSENLYVRLSAQEENIRAEYTSPLSPVWEDSCLEFFFSFDGRSYVNLEANAKGALRAAYGPDRNKRRFLREMEVPLPTAEAVEAEEGWELRLRLPLGLIPALWSVEARPGLTFTGNFYSCGDATPAPHYAAWSPVETQTPDFHRSEFFGELIFA